MQEHSDSRNIDDSSSFFIVFCFYSLVLPHLHTAVNAFHVEEGLHFAELKVVV